MKCTIKWLLLSCIFITIPHHLSALRRGKYMHGPYQARHKPKYVWAFCTLNKPKFVEKQNENGQKTGPVIDIGNGQKIKAGDEFDPDYLASDDPRLGIDFDVKTRLLYECQDLEKEYVIQQFQVECHLRGYDHGMFTDGTKECFRAW